MAIIVLLHMFFHYIYLVVSWNSLKDEMTSGQVCVH